MKIIKPNKIKIGKPDKNDTIDPIDSIANFLRIKKEYIQYVKAEKSGVFIDCQMHPLIDAAHTAFSFHLPLVLSPDIIWYCITCAAATHIKENAEELRKTFVDHEGKKKLSVRRDDFLLGSQSNPWNEVIGEFCEKIADNTKGEIADKVTSDFSTTSDVSKVVSQIVLMDSMQKYFSFYFSTMCGIPEIRLDGEKSDWKELQKKSRDLIQLIPGLEFWLKTLDEITQQFVDAFDDKIDKDFWNSLYKVDNGSGGPYISGWVTGLFPYLDEGMVNPYNDGKQTWRDIEGMFSGLTTSQFYYHMNQVPFVWNYHGDEIKMLFVGGLIGVTIGSDKELTPTFGYSIVENRIETGEQ